MKRTKRQNPFQRHRIPRSAGVRFLVVLVIFFLPAGEATAENKLILGEVEDVILMPWGVRMPARIDTGAATSSLDARELTVRDNIAEFRLPKMYGGLRIRLPVKTWQKIRSADFTEKRPVVEITLCIGPKSIRTQVSLNDRSMVNYPLIIGRNVLKNKFVVDCMHSNCLPPSCPEAPPP